MNTQQEAQHPNQTAQEKGKKRSIKWLKPLLCTISAVFFLFVLSIGGLIGVLRSDSATATLLHFVDKNIQGLDIANVSGNFQDGVTLKNIQFHDHGVNTLVEFVHIKLDFACLWQAEICLDDLTVKNPQVKIDTSLLTPTEGSSSESGKLQRIFLPISINVKNVLLENVAIDVDHHAIRLSHFHTAISLNNKQGFTLSPTQITDFSVVSTLTEERIKEQSHKAQVLAENKPSHPMNWAEIEARLQGPLWRSMQEVVLPFDFHIQDLQGKNWQYQQFLVSKQKQTKSEVKNQVRHIVVSNVQLKAYSTDVGVALEQLEVQSNLGDLKGRGRLNLAGDFPLDLTLQANLNEIKQNQKNILDKTTATLTLNGKLKKQTALLLQSQGGVDARLSVVAELNADKTPFTLSLQSPQFAYTFVENNPLKTKDIVLNAKGNLLDYQLDFTGSVSGMDIPHSQVQLAGRGGINQAEIEKLQLNTLQGQADFAGRIAWKHGIEWQSAVNLADVNVGSYLKSWPAVLSGHLQTQGKMNDDEWDIRVPEADIWGKLSQKNLRLKGNLWADNVDLINTDIEFTYGENKLIAKGVLSEKSNFRFEANAPDLAGLLPHFSGAVIGYAQLTGRIDKPAIETAFTTQNLVYQDFQLGKAKINSNINSADIMSGNIAIDLGGLKYGDITLNNLFLEAQGDEKEHHLNLRSQGSPVSVDLNIAGHFEANNKQWKGELSDVLIKSSEGNISTDKSLQVIYNHSGLQTEIATHCWKHQFAELCFTEPMSLGKSGNIVFQMKRLDLSLINQLTEKDNFLKGTLSGQGKAIWEENTPLQVNTEIEGKNLTLSQKIDYRQFQLDFSKFNVRAFLAENNLTSSAQIQLAPQGSMNVELNIQDISQSRKLSGGLGIQKVSLDLLNQLLNRNESVSGEVYSNLNFSGDLSKPLLNGNLHIRRIGTQIKSLPFNIEQGEVTWQFHGDHSTLNGHLPSQAGKLNLHGEANWQNTAQWQAALNLESQAFLLELPSLGKVKISPNVTAKATPTLLDLRGEVNIPWARLEIEEFPESAVAVSDDEVILNARTTKKMAALSPIPQKVAAKTQSGMLIQSDIKIGIGDDVNVSAYGLKSDLQGLLSLRQAKGNLGLFGQIYLKNGRYHAYGQDLLIRKGEISFSGLSTQPTLNIEAIRNPDAMENNSITAGVKVTGIATKPEVNVFSNPALPQDQALSYLLTGRSLESSGEMGSNGSLGAAVLGLGLAKSGKVVGKIGETFGIQDLNLGTAGVGESSKVEVSGSITPRLKIKYGVGLFDGLAEVTVRYRLLPQLYLQSVSGVNQAFDLLYQFEF
ncbi:MAG: translocation/assembly module TamB domain-containing protein [Lonepinella koalarum]|nr:translocation/assembly module TamB domain-containing protein [Lonepinella koalarum]